MPIVPDTISVDTIGGRHGRIGSQRIYQLSYQSRVKVMSDMNRAWQYR